MYKFEPTKEWATYEANVQAYRSNFLSSQSILLAVGAFVIEKSMILTILISAIGLFQMWFIWHRVICNRVLIVDYHKFGMPDIFDNNGNYCPSGIKNNDYLEEETYVKNKAIRNKINEKLGEIRRKKFTNTRKSRKKIDWMIPISFTPIWIIYIVYGIIFFFER